MTWLYIYIGLSVLAFVLFTICEIEITQEFKRRYPNIERPKKILIEKIASNIKTLITCFIPVINIMFIFIMIFKYDDLTEKTIDRVYTSSLMYGSKEEK